MAGGTPDDLGGESSAASPFSRGQTGTEQAIRTRDWSQTSTGALHEWPPALAHAVRLCLDAPVPMAVWWGAEGTHVYNDALAAMLGPRHPAALGRPAAEAFPEIRETIASLVRDARERNGAVFESRMLIPVSPRGRPEEAWFAASFSPVRDGGDAKGGVLATLLDVTPNVLAERRARLLSAVRDAANRREGSPAVAVAEALASGSEDVPFALLYKAEGDGARLLAAAGVDAESEAAPSRVTSGRDPFGVARALRSAAAHIARLPPGGGAYPRARPWAQGDPAAAVLPLRGEGGHVEGVLVAGLSSALPVIAECRVFLRGLAREIGPALARSDGGERHGGVPPPVRDRGGGRGEEAEGSDPPAALRLGAHDRAERALSVIMSHAPIGIGIFDRSGRWIFRNARLADVFGVGDVIPSSDPDSPARFSAVDSEGNEIPPSEWPGVRALKGETVSQGIDFAVKVRGGRRWLRVRAAPLPGRDGTPDSAILLAADVTEEREAALRLRASGEQLRLAQEVARVGTFEWDIVRNAIRWSPEIERLHGVKPGNFGGRYEDWLATVHPDDVAKAEEGVRSALKSGTLEAEWRIVRPDGEVVWVMARGVVEKGPSNEPLRMFGANVDISARIRTEQEAREEADRRTFLLALSDALASAADPRECQALSTSMTARHLGVERAVFAEVARDGTAVVGADYAEGLGSLAGVHLVGGLLCPAVFRELRRGAFASADVVADERVGDEERRRFAAAGVRSVLATGIWRRGWLVAVYCVESAGPREWTPAEADLLQHVIQRTHDAVERTRAEETFRAALHEQRILTDALSEQRGRLEAVLRHLPVGVWIVDPDGRLAEANAEGIRLIGNASPCSLRDDGPLVLRDPRSGERLPPTADPVGRVLHTREPAGPVEIEVEAEGGEGGTILFSASPIRDDEGTFRGVVGIGLDITEYARLGAALRESEARFRTLVGVVPVLLWQADPSGTDVSLNPRWREYTGQTAEESRHAGWLEAVHPDDRDRTRRLFAEAVEGRTAVEVEYRVRGADRQYRWFLARQVPLFDEAGNLVSWFGAAVDVHDRHVATEALRASEERFRQFAEASLDVIWIRDVRTLEWEYVSPAFETVYGASREAALGEPSVAHWLDLIVPEDREKARTAMSRVRAGEHVTFEYRIRRASDGEIRWLHSTDFPLFDPAGVIRRIGGIGRDVTEARRHAEHLEVMVAELRHRTLNLIAVTRSISERTLRESPSLESYRARFRARLDALARVQFLLSRLEEDERIAFDQILRSELHALALDDDPRVELEGPEGVLMRSAGVQILALALHELITNALKHGGLSVDEGSLSVRWSLKEAGEGEPRLHVEWSERGVRPTAERRSGYGSELIERALPHQLGAETTFSLEPEGVRWTIKLPVSRRMPPGQS